MTGRRFALMAWGALTVVASIAHADEPAPRVAIVRSADLPAYTRPAEAFRAVLADAVPGVVIEDYDLRGDRDRAEQIVGGLRDRGVRVIYAVGAKAAYVAARAGGGTPVVFSSVLDWRSYRAVLGQAHVAGVALEVPADVQLTQLKLLTPRLQRVILVTRGRGANRAVVDDFVAAGRVLRVDVVAIGVDELERLADHANRDRFTTVVYPVADPVVYTPEAFVALLSRARRNKLPVIGFSKEFVAAGAVMAVDVDYGDLGAQVALAAVAPILAGVSPAELGVTAPVGTSLVVNEAAARAIGMPLSRELLHMAADVYDRVVALPEGGVSRGTSERYRARTDDAGTRDPWDVGVSEQEFFAFEHDVVRVASRRLQRVSYAPSVVSVLTGDDLRALGVTNVAEALQHLPGFTVRYTRIGEHQVLFRGQSNPGDVLVLLDGERLNNMYDAEVLYDLGVDHVQRIEVLRGPGSALYGTNAFAAVISIVTYDARSAAPAVGAAGLVFPSGSDYHDDTTIAGAAHARDAVGWGTWRGALMLGWSSSQGAEMRQAVDSTGVFAPDDPHYLDDERHRGEVLLSIESRDLLARGDTLALHPKLLFHQRAGNFGPDDAMAPDSVLRRSVLLVPVDYAAAIARGLELRLRLSYARHDVSEDLQIRADGFSNVANPIPAPDGLRNRTDYAMNTGAAEAQLWWTLPRIAVWNEHVAVAGARVEYGRMAGFDYDQNYTERGFQLLYWENFSDAVRAELESLGRRTEGFENYDGLELRQADADRAVASAYLESQVEVADNPVGAVWVTAGVRADVFSDYRAPRADDPSPDRKTYVTVNPRAALVWAPSLWDTLRGVSVKAMYGTAFLAPSFAQLYNTTDRIDFVAPNEELEPQTTRVAELAFELRPLALVAQLAKPDEPAPRYADALAAEVNLFHMRTDDVFGNDPTFDQGGREFINFEGQRVTGIEAELRLRISPTDFGFVNVSRASSEQLGDCVAPEADGTCAGDRQILDHEIRDFPRLRINGALSVRPVGLVAEAGGRRDSALYRALGSLRLAVAYHHVSESHNNERVVFEQLNDQFSHPGYDWWDIGVGYSLTLWGGTVQVFADIQNLFDADLSDPIRIRLDPRPEVGYFLTRPGRRFWVGLEWLR